MRKQDKPKWRKLRLEIWGERPHVSELSGKPLLPHGHPFWHHQFLHVLPHGKYASEALNKDNIMLALPEEHERQNEFEAFNIKADELRRLHNKNNSLCYGKFD